MPWKECCQVDLRRELVQLAGQPGVTRSELARRFGVSRKTVYKWLERFALGGDQALVDQSRRPHRSPAQTCAKMERCVLKVRKRHPSWGGRKIRRVLANAGHSPVPSASTITAILRRHGLLAEHEDGRGRSWVRFEHAAPNDLWQMDFKGHFALERGGRCHPLTILDDHSRFNLAIRALGDERGESVRTELITVFERYGQPRRMLTDNGSPWGDDSESRHTKLTVWLLEHGIGVIHGRPYHPQTQGKEERFHRTLLAEVIAGRTFADLHSSQVAFDVWRPVYNTERPHEAIDLDVPASRYAVSNRSFRATPEPWDYAPSDDVRRVSASGTISYRGRTWKIGKPFVGKHVGLRATVEETTREVYFRHQLILELDLTDC